MKMTKNIGKATWLAFIGFTLLGFGSAAIASSDKQHNSATAPSAQQRDWLVVVDAGHGGMDSGAAYFGYQEKDLTLSISQQVAEAINSMDGMRAILTRHSDVYMPYKERQKIARQNQGDVLVTIHADAMAPKIANTARGASVYVDRPSEPNVEGDSHNLNKIAVEHQSLRIGEALQSALAEVVPMYSKHVRRQGFIMLQTSHIPSVLVEAGFISHPEEAQELNQLSYQQKIATAIAKGLQQYHQANPLPDAPAASQ